MKDNVFFVSGIDTNVGKSYATGYLAKTWNEQGAYHYAEVYSDGKCRYVGRYRTAP